MAEQLYAISDTGATNSRVAVYNSDMVLIDAKTSPTSKDNYEGSLQLIADTADLIAAPRGEIVAAAVAVAARVDQEGTLTKSGGLTPWVGRNLRKDLEAAFGLEGRVDTFNDVVAIAISQHKVNTDNGNPVDGIAATLGSGTNDALYWANGRRQDDEGGHDHLRPGWICTCGQDGHAEAYVGGDGVKLNSGMAMVDWLKVPENRDQFVGDMATFMANLLAKHAAEYSFEPEEFRWTGSVALNNPFIMQDVYASLRERLDGKTPKFDTATMGEQAGLHGTFVAAKQMAEQY